jgi:hypothetical protein
MNRFSLIFPFVWKQYVFHLKVSTEALANVRKLYGIESLSDIDLRCLLVDSLRGMNLGTPDENSVCECV